MKHRKLIPASLLLALLFAPVMTAAGMDQSAAHVDVATKLTAAQDDSDARIIKLRLQIDDGWHVNAHPASLDFLVPTAIQATVDDETLSPSIDWPAGRDSGIELDGTTIAVFRDGTTIPVHLTADELASARTAGRLTLAVQVQACSDDGICLPPSTLETTVTGL